MRTAILALLLLSALACLASCDDATTDTDMGSPGVVKAADGSLRLPFLGGAFVTRSPAMPPDVAQAIAGEPTDHPVLVWAGD